MSQVIPFGFVRRDANYDSLRDKADDLEQAVSLYLRAVASRDPDKIATRLSELRYARTLYAAFRRK